MRGGKRRGAGRPKGRKSAATLEREAVLRAFRERVMRNAERLYDAQATLAQGCSYLFRRSKSKGAKEVKAQLVTSPTEIQGYLDGEYEQSETAYYFITTERPDNKAIDSLLDRTFGKAAQSMELQHTGAEGGPIQIIEKLYPGPSRRSLDA